MNTSALSVALSQLLGPNANYVVCAADTAEQVIEMNRFPIYCIQNTDPISSPGQHWIAWIIHSKTKAEMFDSFGAPWWSYPAVRIPVKYVTEENRIQLQSDESNYCGLWCLRYLHDRYQGRSYRQFLSQFGKNFMYNDFKILKWSQKALFMFNPSTIYDKSLKNQTCIRKFLNNHSNSYK